LIYASAGENQEHVTFMICLFVALGHLAICQYLSPTMSGIILKNLNF